MTRSRFCFFFNAPAPTEFYTLSLHDALPISYTVSSRSMTRRRGEAISSAWYFGSVEVLDRKSTRLNSSHTVISYAVFCLKKKNDAIYADGTWKLDTPGKNQDRSVSITHRHAA